MSAKEQVTEVTEEKDEGRSSFAQGLISTREAARMLGVSLRTIQLWVDSGVLTAWKTAGGHRRVMIESVEQLKRAGIVRPRADARHMRAAANNQEVFFSRRPVVDGDGRITGMAFPARIGNIDMGATSEDAFAHLTRALEVQFGELGLGSAVGGLDCYLPANPAVASEDMLRHLPRLGVILEFSDLDGSDPNVVGRVKQLKRSGFGIALAGFVDNPADRALLEVAEQVKVPVGSVSDEMLAEMRTRIGKKTVAIASGVDDAESLERAKAAGFDRFEGYAGIWHAPEHAYPSQLGKLLSKVLQDASITEIERILKPDAELADAFVQLANQPHFGVHPPVATVQEALLMLGHRQAGRLLMLLPFRLAAAPRRAALLQLAMVRGLLMEYLGQNAGGRRGVPCEKAFEAGALSVLPAAFGQPMDSLLASTKVPDELALGLLRREGLYGPMLNMIERLEDADYEQGLLLFNRHRVAIPRLMDAQVKALRCAGILTAGLADAS